ncbi:putative Ubiquitin-conjugating enzyme E2 S [Paratrimastix pyriformis]|uniref:Ubiquitin-conjugating enzyme E2 S n=1 Tax=Paratrimastix pyriformis TaxID=342808 RepID=A0ABQ8US65_9EUKA|nr:putative Ubiquitin-conjugating enzyme E2 S [Paratrimastix pyriformis]
MAENLHPSVLGSLTRDLRDLLRRPLEGIRLIIDESDITNIQADLEGPAGTPYEGGIFRMKLVLGPEFPAKAPQGYFLTKIFHPNVAPAGDICVNTLKRDWRPDVGLSHIFMVVRCLLIEPNPESALNEEAAKLQLDDYQAYRQRAALMTRLYATASPAPASDGAATTTTTTTAPPPPAVAPPITLGKAADDTAASTQSQQQHTVPVAAAAPRRPAADKKKGLRRL